MTIMTDKTPLGPLDQGIVEYCASLQVGVCHLAKGVVDPEAADGAEIIGELVLAVTPGAYKAYIHLARWADPKGILQPKLEAFQTAEQDNLAQALRHCLGDAAWPVMIRIGLRADGAPLRCHGLGFAGIEARSLSSDDREPILDLFRIDDAAPHHMLGLDRAREAVSFIKGVLRDYNQRHGIEDRWVQYDQLMAWSTLDQRKHADDIGGQTVYARSPQEALVKWSIFTIGLDATRKLFEDGHGEMQAIEPHLEFMAQPVDLDADPRGRAMTLGDCARGLFGHR